MSDVLILNEDSSQYLPIDYKWDNADSYEVYSLNSDFNYHKLWADVDGRKSPVGLEILPFTASRIYMSEPIYDGMTEIMARSTGNEIEYLDLKEAVNFVNNHGIHIDKKDWMNSMAVFMEDVITTYETSDLNKMYDDTEDLKIVINEKFTQKMFQDFNHFIQENNLSNDDLLKSFKKYKELLNVEEFSQENILKQINYLENTNDENDLTIKKSKKLKR